MKFSNGCWLQKESCSCFSPQEVYFTTIEETKVTILAPTIHITQRGDTLSGSYRTGSISTYRVYHRSYQRQVIFESYNEKSTPSAV